MQQKIEAQFSRPVSDTGQKKAQSGCFGTENHCARLGLPLAADRSHLLRETNGNTPSCFHPRLHPLPTAVPLTANRLKTFRADDMLDAASVLGSDDRIDAQPGQPIGEHRMALINTFCDFTSFVAQTDAAVPVKLDIAVLTKIFHRDTDTRLGKIQCVGDVHRTDGAVLPAEDENGLQIVLGDF